MKQELERQADSLPAIPENSEEVEALEVRVSALENEISILREVTVFVFLILTFQISFSFVSFRVLE